MNVAKCKQKTSLCSRTERFQLNLLQIAYLMDTLLYRESYRIIFNVCPDSVTTMYMPFGSGIA